MQWCRGNSLAERLPACIPTGAQMQTSAVGASGRESGSASHALAAAAAQGSESLPAEVTEVVAPARGNVLAKAAAKPAAVQPAMSDSSAPSAAVKDTARHTDDASQGPALDAPRLLSPADMMATLSTVPRATRLERSHAVLELAASPANRRRLVQRRPAAAAVAEAAETAPPAEPEQALIAGSEPALASTGELQPAACLTDAGKDRLVPAPQPARASEPAVLSQVLSAVSARPSVPQGSAAEPGESLADSARPARRQHDTAPSLQQPEALTAAAPRSQDGAATGAALTNNGAAPAARHAPSAEATVLRQPSPSVRGAQVTTRERIVAEAASGVDVVSDPSTAEQHSSSDLLVAASKTADDSCRAGLPDSGGLQPPNLVAVAAPLTAAVRPPLAAVDAAQVNALPPTLLSELFRLKVPGVDEASASGNRVEAVERGGQSLLS